ncbi:MAG: CPXCG motif-containing cysteine-rich protein [Halomonadaceae bacterium]|nr:MAG: CPXCG motif-containing cysteine-rich protein [Halomonadaceae bacterium]
MLDSVTLQCPYCWESIELLIDCSVDQQSYVEDCSVCCRPIHLEVMVDASGEPVVQAYRDDD